MATIKLFGLDGQEKGGVEVADKDLVLDRGELIQQIKLYLPARTAIVLRRTI